MPKKLKVETLWDFSTSILAENIKKLKGGPFGEKKILEKKSHRAENTLREYPLAPLSFLDVKILLRKLSKNYKKLRNCKFVRILRKVDLSE